MSLYLDAMRAGAATSLKMRKAECVDKLLRRTFTELSYSEYNELFDRALFGELTDGELDRVWPQIDDALPKEQSALPKEQSA